jgi:hypothetical protein
VIARLSAATQIVRHTYGHDDALPDPDLLSGSGPTGRTTMDRARVVRQLATLSFIAFDTLASEFNRNSSESFL